MTKENLSPNVREIVVDSIRGVASFWTPNKNWPKKGSPNLSTVEPQYRRIVLKDAAFVADMKVLSSLDRGGLDKDEEVQLFTITDRMRAIAEDPNRLTGKKSRV